MACETRKQQVEEWAMAASYHVRKRSPWIHLISL